MNCQFCYQPCLTVAPEWYKCSGCDVHYHTHAVCLYTQLNGIGYTVRIYKEGKIKMSISSPYEDPIMTFDHDGNISPKNVKDKLKTYLTFS